jgi:mitochondrial fission protein ELM1
VLAAGRTCGGKTVVMMKPSLPCSLFDLCVVPEHDDVKASVRVLVTRGVLNRIRPTPDKDPYRGLILLGGPSKHYRWDDTTLLVQLREITSETRIHWTLATSRRTPDSMLQLLREDLPEVVDIVPWQETDKDWLPRQLDQAFRVWISEDSVSMVYEAMTSGAHCGLLEVPLRRSSRVRRGLQKLIDSSRIVTFSQWETTGRLGDVWEGPSEAQRVAQWLAEEWGLTNHG